MRKGLGLGAGMIATVGLSLLLRGPKKTPTEAELVAAYPRIDTHMHVSPDGIPRLVALMDRWGLAGAVNLSGMSPGPPRHALETQLEAARKTGGRLAVFMSPRFYRAIMDYPEDYGTILATQVREGHALGAVGLKITKGLGLGYPAPDRRSYLPVDDPGLDPVFEAAGELNMPVAIHTGDPKAFWLPADKENERLDELEAHPNWHLYGRPVPSWEALLAQFERRVARHPQTTFIGVHFGNAPEEPERVERMLRTYPNLYIDLAARIPEIGRHDPQRMRALFIEFADRILFATDTGVGASQESMMYGSTGPEPATAADERRFFKATYRYLQTDDKAFPHPTPIQGRWRINGISLPDDVLKKIYYDNAARLLGWAPELPADGAGRGAAAIP